MLLSVILSNLLRDYSFQDPTQLRIRVRNDDPPSNLIATFENNLNYHIKDLKAFSLICPMSLKTNIEIKLGDARTIVDLGNIMPGSIDAIITSPPYATALPYIDTDRLSIFAFGFATKSNFRSLEESLIGNREITKSKRVILDKELENNFNNSILPSEIITLLKKIYFLNKNADVGFRRKNTAALLFKYFLDMHFSFTNYHKQ